MTGKSWEKSEKEKWTSKTMVITEAYRKKEAYHQFINGFSEEDYK